MKPIGVRKSNGYVYFAAVRLLKRRSLVCVSYAACLRLLKATQSTRRSIGISVANTINGFLSILAVIFIASCGGSSSSGSDGTSGGTGYGSGNAILYY